MQLDHLYSDINEGKGIHIAALLALGFGIPTISKMLNMPRHQVAKVASKEQSKEPESETDQPPVASAPALNYMALIEPHEGRRNVVYHDTVGVPTVGIGFNLQRNDAADRLAAVGANLQQVLNGTALTNDQINVLFRQDVGDAEQVARGLVNNFDNLPANARLVLVDMAFNMGPRRLGGFHNFLQAVNNGNYDAAADEMVNSRWYNQVGNRSRELERMMRAAR